MTWIALRMLTGDRSKYLGLIFGVTFATLLMTQQVSIFMGILTRTGNQILEVRDAQPRALPRRGAGPPRHRPDARPRRAGRGLGSPLV